MRNKIKFKKKVIGNSGVFMNSPIYHGSAHWFMHKSVSAWSGLVVDLESLETCLGCKDCDWLEKEDADIEAMIDKAMSGELYTASTTVHNVIGEKESRRLFESAAGDKLYINDMYVVAFGLDAVYSTGNGGVRMSDDKLIGVMPCRY